MPVCVLLTEKGCVEKEIDDAPRSTFVQDTLEGDGTILGSWDDSSVIMLGRREHSRRQEVVPASLLPTHGREEGPLLFPIMFTRLSREYVPIDFTISDYHALVGREDS